MASESSKIAVFGNPSYIYLPPRRRGSPGPIFVNFFSGCQWMAQVPNDEETLPKFSTGWVGRTNVTDDSRNGDSI